MNEQQAKALLKKYNDGTATAEERQQIETYFFRYLEKKDALPDEERLLLDQAQVRARLQAHMAQSVPTIGHKRSWARILAAASVLIAMTAGGYFLLHKKQAVQLVHNQPHDVAPGTKHPVLTLANGQQVVIADTKKGRIAQQGAVAINQTATGSVVYTKSNEAVADAPLNTLANPRGSKLISLVLPDGSLVKLDAGSSITYRTAYTGKTREVSTTGRVYFEVKRNVNQPFLVTSNGQTTEDLGTHFIIEAYNDEPTIKTTLLEGKVAVSKAGQKTVLQPGQQSLLQSNNIKVIQADLDNETAWLNGDFQFDGQDLQSTMREISRAYDVDVVYQDVPRNLRLGGEVSRSKNLSVVLAAMELTGKVHFKIDGRRITVMR